MIETIYIIRCTAKQQKLHKNVVQVRGAYDGEHLEDKGAPDELVAE